LGEAVGVLKVKAVLIAGLVGLGAAVVSAQTGAQGLRPEGGPPSDQVPGVLQKVAFEQRLNERLPLDLEFTSEDGRTVKLGEFFGARPVILTFVYYECPMLCTQVLNGLESAMRVMDEGVGREFEVVTVSFDPRETAVLAAAKKKAYLDRYKRTGAERGWHFLTGSQASIDALTMAAGFSYVWDEESKQFAHASGVVVATPAGTIARYFFGIDYAPRDLKFALMESSEGRIGSLADHLLLYCYHYDAAQGQYGFVAMRAVRIGGAVTLLALAGFVFVSIRRDRQATGQ
jgi:protein SCO1/2